MNEPPVSPSFSGSSAAAARVPVCCAVCQSTDSTPFAVATYTFVDGDFDVVRCTQCGFVYVNPRLPREAIEDDYVNRPFPTSEKQMRVDHEEQLPYHRFMVRKVERFFPNERRQRLRIVEVGAGWGGLLVEANARGHVVEGVEIGHERARYVREKLGIAVHRGDVFDAPCTARSYDVVYCLGTLEHLDDPRANLVAMREWLKDDGILALGVPNLDFIGGRVKDGRMTDDPRHLSHFTAKTLTRLLRESGYDPVEVHAGFPLLGVWRRFVRNAGWLMALAGTTLRLTDGLGRGSDVFAFARRTG